MVSYKTLIGTSLLLLIVMMGVTPAVSAGELLLGCSASDPDTDNDGVCDSKDPDDDNDGVPDGCDPYPKDVNDLQRWLDYATYLVRGCAITLA